MTTQDPLHLTGVYAPVREERDDTVLEVVGTLPRDLCGVYVRNGPSPRSGRSPAWFAGDGMLHAVRLDGGRACWHRSRWIGGAYAPNTNVIRHAGRILALVETRLPVEVDADLKTIGSYDFGGALSESMTAHPRRCPRKGELLLFSYGASAPHLTFYRADPAGHIVHRAPVDVPAMTYMHDFAITERFAVFYDLPVLVGSWRSPTPLRWEDSYGARFGLVPREGGPVRWLDIPPCTISHTLNAFEDGDRVIVDAVCAPRLMTMHQLCRFTLDLRTGQVEQRVLDPRFVDFPQLHPACVGRRNRLAYTTELCDFVPGGFTWTVLRQHDLEAGTAIAHDFGPAWMPGECVVAPRGDDGDEAEAWVIVFLHERDGAAPSELAILDARDFAAPPVARVRLPTRVPFGLHGAWLPDA